MFVDFDTVTVKPGGTESLDIAIPDKGCFGQIDLYRGAVKFDGELDAKDGFEHGDLPKGPDRPVIKDKLIAAWNGGTKNCTTPPPAETEPPASTPPASPSEPAEETTPPATPSEPAEPSTPPSSDTDTPTPSASESTPVAPKPNGGGGDLAETGADSSTGPIALGAAALLAGGAALVVATRRRAAKRNA